MATHMDLQYLNFSDMNISAQVSALREKQLLTPEQAEAVDIPALRRFLSSPLAQELRQAEQAGRKPLREYRFALLVPAREYDPQASEKDSILLQGVADCCFESEQGLTVIDFKTDYIRTPEDIRLRAEYYRPQLEAYSLALSRVLERSVTRRVLFFLTSGDSVEV